MTVPGHYHSTIMAPIWHYRITKFDPKSHVLKIGQNYSIVSAKINRKFIAPSDMIFFTTIWHFNR